MVAGKHKTEAEKVERIYGTKTAIRRFQNDIKYLQQSITEAEQKGMSAAVRLNKTIIDIRERQIKFLQGITEPEISEYEECLLAAGWIAA